MKELTAALIYKQMPLVMGEIGAIGKDRRNPQQGYSFRGIDDVYNAVNHALVNHGVFCTPEVMDIVREERQTKAGGVMTYTILTVRYTFYAADGSFVSCVTKGEAADSGDKSCNKAMSAAQKYAFFQVFAIPTEETKDTEIESPQFKAKTAPATKKAAAESTDATPLPCLSKDDLVAKMETAENIFELKARYTKYAADIKALSGEERTEVMRAKDMRKVALDEAEKAAGKAQNEGNGF